MVFAFMGIVIFLLFKMVYLFFGALLIWIVTKVKNIDISYGKSYQLGLHLIALPTIIWLIPLGDWKFRFLFSIVVVVLAAINLKKEELSSIQEKVEEVKKEEEIKSENK
jgi:hypothetical protein